MKTDFLLFTSLDTGARIALVLAIAVLAHLCVLAIRRLVQHLMSTEAMLRWTKLRTLLGLIISILVFILYFGAIGLVLSEFGVSLTAYLASASILGLAIGFGSQAIVQDVVTGLTVIFSDQFQIGDLVEISGQTGIVQNISMRFTTLLNPLGAKVFIPNHTLSNVILYPRGYVRCYADIYLSSDKDTARQMQEQIKLITHSFVQQFPGVLRNKPEIEPTATTATGRDMVRVKFRIWPGRNDPIENVYRQEIIQTFKTVDVEYADWMVSINNEVSEKPQTIQPFRTPSSRPGGEDKRKPGNK